MFQSTILDVAIGMIFLFLLLSLLATAIQELIASKSNFRGKLLKSAIQNMVGEDFTSKILSHPLIASGQPPDTLLPSYIDKKNFSKALAQQLTGYTGLPERLRKFPENLTHIPNENLRKVLQSFNAASMEELEGKAGDWFDTVMDRWSGQYKRHTQKFLFWMGLGIAVILNADAIAVFKYLSTDRIARNALVTQAIQYTQDHPDSTAMIKSAHDLLQKEIDGENAGLHQTLGIGWYWDSIVVQWEKFGWVNWYDGFFWIVFKLIGWIICATAIMIGAPFWFDTLKKIIQIRNAGVKPEEKG